MPFAEILRSLSPEQPVLIAGPTASGKSALALEVAESQGGVIVNADASQVYDCWRVLTARPSARDEARARHRLYGHIAATQTYSTGHWLREVLPLLREGRRVIVTGGTGLYFKALTDGLAEIPPTPPDVRAEADALPTEVLLAGIDVGTAARIDRQNRARIQRAWEVQQATGRPLARWQDDTGPPALALDRAFPIVFDVPRDVLNARIARRFDAMIDAGALDEARAVAPSHDPALPAHLAIGAPELVACVRGEMTLDAAREATVIATRQYAKRQRTWMRSRMADWRRVTP